MQREVRSAAPYGWLSRDDFDDALAFVATGGYALRSYERFAKIRKGPDGLWRVRDGRVAQQYRLNVGTIVEATTIKVRLARTARARPGVALPRGGKVLGEIEELIHHLDEMTRLDLDLADPVAHLRRHALAGRLRVPGERLGQEADRRERRPQLMGQVVDELPPDLLQPAELRHVLEDDPHPADRGAAGADDEDRALGAAQPELAGRPAGLASAVDQLLDARVDERLQRRSAAEAPGRPTEQDVGGGVRQLDGSVVVQPDDADSHEVGQV